MQSKGSGKNSLDLIHSSQEDEKRIVPTHLKKPKGGYLLTYLDFRKHPELLPFVLMAMFIPAASQPVPYRMGGVGGGPLVGGGHGLPLAQNGTATCSPGASGGIISHAATTSGLLTKDATVTTKDKPKKTKKLPK